MSQTRLTSALEGHGLELPESGNIAVFAPHAGADLGAIARDRVRIIQPNRVDYDAFKRAGYSCDVRETGRYGAAIVCLPRAKQLARDLIARAVAVADLVIVDGQKTDGADSLLKACEARAEIDGVISKAHGKLFWFAGGDFADWHAAPTEVDGFVTRAGCFRRTGLIRPQSYWRKRFRPNWGATWPILARAGGILHEIS